MSRFEFKLPDIGEGVAEAEIVAWHVQPGDEIAEDQPLVDVMTDKATVEITSPVAGRVLSLEGAPGVAAAIGSVLAVLDLAGGEAVEAAPARAPVQAYAPVVPPAMNPPVAQPPPVRAETRPLASPAVRRRAMEQGVDLAAVSGSGPGGRVTQADLAAFAAPARRAPRDIVEEVKVLGLRRRIAERMSEAKRRIPHFSYIEEVDVTDLERLRAQLNVDHGDRGRLTVLPFIVRAMVRTLPAFPQINALFDDEAEIVRRHTGVHLGVATQTDAGLVVPVVRHAEALGLWETAAEIARLAEAARSGRATRDELGGSTITVTSLGPLGGLATTPVINRPEVAILGPNRIVERPVVVDGAVVVRKMMNLSSSFDHRVVDGWDAAEFVQRLKRLLENPALMFVERS